MSGVKSQLPAGFEALEPFVQTWAITGAANRAALRLASNEADRVAFFEVGQGLLGPALAHLDAKPLHQLDDKEKRLMNLMLSLAHVSLAVEVQGDDEPKHALSAQYLRITRAPSDVNA